MTQRLLKALAARDLAMALWYGWSKDLRKLQVNHPHDFEAHRRFVEAVDLCADAAKEAEQEVYEATKEAIALHDQERTDSLVNRFHKSTLPS